jgi:hypothetical protein
VVEANDGFRGVRIDTGDAVDGGHELNDKENGYVGE